MRTPTIRAMALGLAVFMLLQAPATYAEGEELPTEDLAPTVGFAAAGTQGNASYWLSDVAVTVSCQDDVGVDSLVASVDGADAAPVDGPIVLSGDGTHTVYATCVDTAANTAELGIVVRIDTTGAVAEATVAQLVLGDYSVSWVASDATSGLKAVQVEMLMPNNEWRTFCTSGFSGEDDAAGSCSLPRYLGRRCHRIVAEDMAGHFATSGEACTQTAPVTNERTPLPAGAPCAVYGESADDGDQRADYVIVRSCGVSVVSDGSLDTSGREDTVIELP